MRCPECGSVHVYEDLDDPDIDDTPYFECAQCGYGSYDGSQFDEEFNCKYQYAVDFFYADEEPWPRGAAVSARAW